MKNFKFRFQKLYARHDEYGVVPNAIIVYAKRGYEQRSERHKTWISKYQNHLTIDLWFVLLRWSWISNAKTSIQDQR